MAADEREPSGEPETEETPPDREDAEQPEPGTEERPSDGDDSSSGDTSSSGERAAVGPSLGPKTDLAEFQQRRSDPDELAERTSDIDAMGLAKRRQIVGGTYGPTKTRLIATFSATIAVILGIGFGLYLLAKDLDAPPEQIQDKAVWSAPDAQQRPPKPIQ